VGATYIRQGDHQVDHWPIFLVTLGVAFYMHLTTFAGIVVLCDQEAEEGPQKKKHRVNYSQHHRRKSRGGHGGRVPLPKIGLRGTVMHYVPPPKFSF